MASEEINMLGKAECFPSTWKSPYQSAMSYIFLSSKEQTAKNKIINDIAKTCQLVKALYMYCYCDTSSSIYVKRCHKMSS